MNHFGGIGALTRKDLLKRHIERARAAFGSRGFDFVPETYLLPKEYAAFVEELSGLGDDDGAAGALESPTSGEARRSIWCEPRLPSVPTDGCHLWHSLLE